MRGRMPGNEKVKGSIPLGGSIGTLGFPQNQAENRGFHR